jgi:hypothetical protein
LSSSTSSSRSRARSTTRRRVDELRPPAVCGERVERPLEEVDLHPVGVHLDLDQLRLVGAECGHGAGVGRAFGDDDVARVEQRLADEVDRLLTARRDDHLIGGDRHSLRGHQLDDAVLHGLQALGRPVLERLRSGCVRDVLEQRAEQLGLEQGGVREAAGERDDLRSLGDRHQVADRR